MQPRIDRRAVIAGGVAAGAGLVLTFLIRDSDRATAQRVADRETTERIFPPPPIVTRAAWGANETLRHGDAEFDGHVEKIVVHHTGTRNDASDWATEVRQIYEFETSNGYNDLSYHYLVDPNGAIYEGRWARDYAVDAVHDSENDNAKQVQGAHTKEHNRHTIGIALLGDFNASQPSAAAVDALVSLLAWKCVRWELDPVGTAEYRLDHGSTEDLPTIFGHGLVRQTECPGANLNATLPELREQVAARIAATVPR